MVRQSWVRKKKELVTAASELHVEESHVTPIMEAAHRLNCRQRDSPSE